MGYGTGTGDQGSNSPSELKEPPPSKTLIVLGGTTFIFTLYVFFVLPFFLCGVALMGAAKSVSNDRSRMAVLILGSFGLLFALISTIDISLIIAFASHENKEAGFRGLYLLGLSLVIALGLSVTAFVLSRKLKSK